MIFVEIFFLCWDLNVPSLLAMDSRVQWGFLKQHQAERRNDASKIKVPGSLSQRKWNVTEGFWGKRLTQWSVHSSFSPLKNNYICSNMGFWFIPCSKQKETLMFPIVSNSALSYCLVYHVLHSSIGFWRFPEKLQPKFRLKKLFQITSQFQANRFTCTSAWAKKQLCGFINN